MFAQALALLREMLGPTAAFRAGQWEAIESLAVHRQRSLIVQRTGWGKSVVYFVASKLLRSQGAGPTLLISPLLSLMRNQVAMAGRIGIRAATIHSGNRKEWQTVEEALARNSVDVLLISPERLNNEHFLHDVLPKLQGSVGLFVVDEAHCISDWGHDFRPDYRRIQRIVQLLPNNVPVLATTATANNRVVEDVRVQLGLDLLVQRGALARTSLRLQNLRIPDQANRLAWLAENLNKFPGSGIIYCLTVADTERVARWLQSQGLNVKPYHAGDDAALDRESLEQELLDNQVKALVATVALGMGFDKPDLGFVVHFQRPGSVVAYYQQVGRAGRAVDRAYAILLNGLEDDDIQHYFIDSAFPKDHAIDAILDVLAQSSGLTLQEILAQANISRTVADRVLKSLEIDGVLASAREKTGVHFFRTPNPYRPDRQRIEQILALRRHELAEMQSYVRYTGCLMEYLTRALDDDESHSCGVCANCQKRGFTADVPAKRVRAALDFLKRDELVLEPRKRWPTGLFPDQSSVISQDHGLQPGRILCYYGDSGWGKLVRQGKYVDRHFADEIVSACAAMIQLRWRPDPPPTWVTAIPSARQPTLLTDFVARLAQRLGWPFVQVLGRPADVPEQKTMANTSMKAKNAKAGLAMVGTCQPGPVLLVDDIIDSGWTMTVAGWLLRSHGCPAVFPLALARTVGQTL